MPRRLPGDGAASSDAKRRRQDSDEARYSRRLRDKTTHDDASYYHHSIYLVRARRRASLHLRLLSPFEPRHHTPLAAARQRTRFSKAKSVDDARGYADAPHTTLECRKILNAMSLALYLFYARLYRTTLILRLIY